METEQNKKHTAQPTIARLLREEFIKRKQQLAAFLNHQLNKRTPFIRRLVFLFTGIAISATIIGVMYHSVADLTVFKSFRSEPVHLVSPGNQGDEEIITPDEYQIMLGFRQTLDSLEVHDPLNYRKLMRNHPSLLDSIQLLLHIYQSTH